MTRLEPLSPQHPSAMSPHAYMGGGPLSPVLSPLTQPPTNLVMGTSPPIISGLLAAPPAPLGSMTAASALAVTPGILNKIDEGHEGSVLSPQNTAATQQTEGDATAPSSAVATGAQPPSPPTLNNSQSGSPSTQLVARRGSGLQIDLACLARPEQRGLSMIQPQPAMQRNAGGSSATATPSKSPALPRNSGGTSNGAGVEAAPWGLIPSVKVTTHKTPQSTPTQLKEHISQLKAALGEGEGVTALLRASAHGKGHVVGGPRGGSCGCCCTGCTVCVCGGGGGGRVRSYPHVDSLVVPPPTHTDGWHRRRDAAVR